MSGATRGATFALFARNRLAVGGMAVVVVAVLAALGAPFLGLPDPDATALDRRLLPPLTGGHLLGTDHLGRDIAARLVAGLRVSLAVAVAATALAGVVGSAIGLVAGYRSGWVDSVLMRAIDVLMAFPYLLLALAIVAALGPGLVNALMAVAVVNVPFFARTVRGATQGEVGRAYVDAARLSGFGTLRILLGEVLPNVLPAVVVTMAATVGWMILETAGLSFLGLGAQPPQADLGSMLGEGRKVYLVAPHVAVVPGVAILVLVMAINLVADGVRDTLDPRLRAGGLARPQARTAVTARDEGAPEAEAPLLRVRGLTVRFDAKDGPVTAVDNVDFDIGRGECVGLVGESGSGKSVSALALVGLVPTPPGSVVSGSAHLDGRSLLHMPFAHLRRVRGGRIGFVFQDAGAALNPVLPVGEQIAEAVRAHEADVTHGQADTRAAELLDLVGIPDARRRAGALPHELSGGQRQRVMIAIAFANRPDLVIADEPTTALDVTTQDRILRLLDRLRRENDTGVLFISHDLAVVSQVAGRVVVMKDGRVVEAGTTADVLGSPRQDYTRRLAASVPRLGRPDTLLRAPGAGEGAR